MSRPGQKPLEGLIAAVAGLIAVYPDPTINKTGELINGCLAELVKDLIGEDQAEALFDDAIAALAPQMLKEFGMEIVSIKSLEKRATDATEELVTRLRKGGL